MLRRNVGLAVAAGALALAAIGTAVAAIPGEDGVVAACIAEDERSSRTGLLGPRVTLDREGTLRAVDAETGEACADDEQPLSFNVKGEPGEQGPPGPPGAPGVAGSIAVHFDQTELPTDFNFSMKRLSADGTGLLEVPSPARLQLNGVADFGGTSAYFQHVQCHVRLYEGVAPLPDPPQPLGGEIISGEYAGSTVPETSGIVTIPLAGYKDVPAGSYDLAVTCRASAGSNPVDMRWSNLDLNVLAVPSS